MEGRTPAYIAFAALALLLLLGCAAQEVPPDIPPEPEETGPGEPDAITQLAQCLAEKGAVMYGTDWCPHCTSQRALFGTSFEEILYVDCELSRDECISAGVMGYPTWVIEGEFYEGTHPLKELAQLTGC